MRAFIPVYCVMLLVAGAAGATKLVVDPYGTGQFATIQDAITAASAGDIIELADGVYAGAGNRDLDLQGKAITIRSQSHDPATCILDPKLGAAPSDTHCGFIIENGETRETAIEGLTVMYGYRMYGGAVYVFGASPTFRNCHFLDNRAGEGGGAYIYYHASPAFIDCLFAGNSTSDFGGGAVCVNYHCEPEFEQCGLIGNICLYGAGAAIRAIQDDTLHMRSCTIALNEVPNGFGAVWSLGENCLVTLDRSVISHNYGFRTYWGTGEAFASCTDIWGNSGGEWGGPLEGQLGVRDNFSADPLYCDIPDRDMRVAPESPCAPEQNPECGLVGAYPAGCAPMAVNDEPPIAAELAFAVTSPTTTAVGSTLRFAVPGAQAVHTRITIHDLLGREITTLINRPLAPGEHTSMWNGQTTMGTTASPGVYFCRLQCGALRTAQTIVLTD